MFRSPACGGSSRSGVVCKITSALLVVALAIFIACIADSYHKVLDNMIIRVLGLAIFIACIADSYHKVFFTSR